MLDHIFLTVSDLDRSIAFYERRLQNAELWPDRRPRIVR